MVKTYKAQKIDITKSPKALEDIPVSKWSITSYAFTVRRLQQTVKLDNRTQINIKDYLCKLLCIEESWLKHSFFIEDIITMTDADDYLNTITFKVYGNSRIVDEWTMMLNFGNTRDQYLITDLHVNVCENN
jgi:uncharacterized protein YkvS